MTLPTRNPSTRIDQTEMAGSTTLGRGNFGYQFRVLYQLDIKKCDGKRGVAAVFGGKMGVKRGVVSACPLRRRNLAEAAFS